MPRRVPSLIALAGAAAVSVLPQAAAGAEATDSVRARYTKYEYRIPMRDGMKLFTVGLRAQGRGRTAATRSCSTGRRTASRPTGATTIATASAPRRLAAKEGFIFAYQDVRGRFMSEGEFVDVRPYIPAKGPEGRRRDERHLGHDRLAREERAAATTARSGMLGHLVSGLLRRDGGDRRPSGAGRGLAPGARSPTGSSATTSTTTGPSSCRTPSTSTRASASRAPSPRRSGTPRSTTAPPTATSSSCGAGPMPSLDRRYLKGEVAFWNEVMAHETYDDFWKARNIRPHLKKIRPAVMTVGGWFDAEDLVRRRSRPTRSIEAQSPGTANRLVMGPWSHGGWSRGDGEALGKLAFGSQTVDVLPRSRSSCPFFALLPEGRRRPEAARGVRVRDGHATSGGALDAWPPRDAKPVTFYLAAQAPALAGAAGRVRRGLRRVRQRSGEARALHRATSTSAWSATTWSRTSASPRGGRTCSSTRPSRSRKT